MKLSNSISIDSRRKGGPVGGPSPVLAPGVSGEELYYLVNRYVGVSLYVNPNGAETSTLLEYADNPDYSNSISVPGDVIAGTGNNIVGFIIPGQKPGSYYYRVKATNSAGTSVGDSQPYVIYSGVGRTRTDYTVALLAVIASMSGETIYIDPSSIDPIQDGTEAHPYHGWNLLPANLSGGNKYLQKRGTTYQASTGILRTISGRCMIGAYGEGSDYAYVIAGTNAGSDFISSTNQLVIVDMDVMGYRSAGIGTELGRGIRLRNNGDGAVMNHWIFNCRVHRFNFGVDSAIYTGNYFSGAKILYTEIYETRLDGLYPTGLTDYEISHCYIHDVNNYFFIDPDQSNSNGDGVQIAFENASIPSVHLVFSFHHNTVDKSSSRNKFCLIWNEYLNGESATVFNNHFIAPVTVLAAQESSGMYIGSNTRQTGTNTANIFNNIFEDGTFGIRGFMEAGASIHHNVFLRNKTAISIGGDTGGGKSASIYNNVFKDYLNTGVSIGMSFNTQTLCDVRVKNNVFDSVIAGSYAIASSIHPVSGLNGIGGLLESDYNHFYRGNVAAITNGGGVYATLASWQAHANAFDVHSGTGDPLWVDADNYNFSILPASPLRDSATDVLLTSDFAGSPLPQGTTFDKGVLEFVA